MSMNGKPSPDVMCKNNLTFITVYILKDPPELLFKHCTDCQEIAIVAWVPYTANGQTTTDEHCQPVHACRHLCLRHGQSETQA
jgi:hypothetical protein